MSRKLWLLALPLLLAILLLPRPYQGRSVPAGDLPPLVTQPAVFSTSAQTPLDLNTATEEQLQSLPGIGPTRAQSIVAYRTCNGPFQSAEELAAVDGIGAGILDQVRDYITVLSQEE